ncbi:hypothetical protein GC163_12555 [bacterium]|nr:hypothetical protein [bacterium]
MTTIGKLRHRITVEEPSTARDETGQVNPSDTWATFAERYAAIEPVSSNEPNGEKPEAQTTHRITLRYLSGLSHDQRIKLGSRVFQIVGIRNIDERNIWQEVTAIERLH